MSDNSNGHRIVSHEPEPGRHVTAIVRRTEESDQLTDAEIVADLDAWRAQQEPTPGE